MRSETGTHGQRNQTFIEAARRAQIVTAAIETIAGLGYGQASLARIAERAGTSKGVISYHFPGKDDLAGVARNQAMIVFPASIRWVQRAYRLFPGVIDRYYFLPRLRDLRRYRTAASGR
jgi:AcrR family transcriptional regulator